MLAKLKNWPSLLLIFLLLGVGFAVRLQPSIKRPLEQDELLTLKKYCNVDYDSTAEEMKHKKAPDLRRCALGFARCFINIWTPNNHIANSLLVSFSNAILGFSELTCRLPSAVASILLAVVVFAWLLQKTDSRLLAFLAGLVLLFHPYFMYYGQATRGYALTALLVAIQVCLLDWAWERRPSTGTIVGLALVNIVVYVTLVSTLPMWIMPLYAVGWICLALRKAQTGGVSASLKFWNDEDARAWFFQAIVAAIGIGIFTLANLREFLGSQSKYGAHLASRSEIPAQLSPLVHSLFPSLWILLPIVGGIGWVLMLGKSKDRWLGAVAIASVVASLAYIFLSKTIPYTRTFGFFLVLLVMGVGPLWTSFQGALQKVLRLGTIIVLVALTAIGVIKAKALVPREAPYSVLSQEITSQIQAAAEKSDSAFIPLPWVWGEEMRFYLPPGTDYISMNAAKHEKISVYFTTIITNGASQFRVQYRQREKQEMVYWPVPVKGIQKQMDDGAVEKISARVYRDFAEVPAGQTPLMVIWNHQETYFNLESYVADKLRKNEKPWDIPVNTISYLPVKSLQMFLKSADDFVAAKAIVDELKTKSSGEVYILVPDAKP